MAKLAVVAKIPAVTGRRDELAAALESLLDAARAEAGTLAYILHADDRDPDLLWMYELYESPEALQAHQSSDAIRAAGPTLAPLLAGRVEMTFLTPLGGKGA